jgi:hypothetical protein
MHLVFCPRHTVDSFSFFCNYDGMKESYYIQDVNICYVQCSVVDRWVQSDRILLIHSCPEILYLHARAFEMWRRIPVGKQPIELLE